MVLNLTFHTGAWYLLRAAAALGLLVAAGTAQAQNLVTLYESARGFDASYQSARLQFEDRKSVV